MSCKCAKVISFVGGLVFFSVIAGVVLLKNDRMRAEVESQAANLLKTTKNVVNQVRAVASGIGKTMSDDNIAIENSNIVQAELLAAQTEYDAQWRWVEA